MRYFAYEYNGYVHQMVPNYIATAVSDACHHKTAFNILDLEWRSQPKWDNLGMAWL